MNVTKSAEEVSYASATKNPKIELKTESIKIPPIDLDQSGRPILPLELPAGLTIYSIGEVSRYESESNLFYALEIVYSFLNYRWLCYNLLSDKKLSYH